MREIEEFLEASGPLYDVRSPSEFLQGSIRTSINLPLFSDGERAKVGTIYKQCSPEKAFLLGLEIAGPKLQSFAKTGLIRKSEGVARIFCFRGGQRSGSMAWLFRMAGIETITLKGGYKKFRTFVLEMLSKKLDLRILGGLTGSGKTAYLNKLKNEKTQVIDLEALACHRGSVFGMLGCSQQPTNESFENALGDALYSLDLTQPIWIEDESRMIGSCKIPDALYAQMQNAPHHFLEVSKEERLNRLVADYGQFPKADLIKATLGLSKRLGALRTKEIVTHIQKENLEQAASLLLNYYDRAYIKFRSNYDKKSIP